MFSPVSNTTVLVPEQIASFCEYDAPMSPMPHFTVLPDFT